VRNCTAYQYDGKTCYKNCDFYGCPTQAKVCPNGYQDGGSDCYSFGTEIPGTLNTSYSCPSGWSTYSGSGSSLKCYRAATQQ